MADETTSSTISELYTEIVAEAMFTASEQSIMKGLVRNYTIAGGGKSVEVPIYPTVSASAVSEAADLANTAINLEDSLGIIGRLFPSLLYLMSEDKN